jgi:integrative and conjugative element protein (TIGR02256 family)
MAVEAGRWFPRETGGVWMGYEAGDDVVVTCVIGPGPRAVHEEARFEPDAEYQLAEIDRHYQESGRVDSYVGEWHTHPLGGVNLSPVDQRALREVAQDPASRQPAPLMAILAGGSRWRLCVWRYRRAWFGTATDPVMVRIY